MTASSVRRASSPLSRAMRGEGIPLDRGVLRLTRRGRFLALAIVTVLLFVAFSAGRATSNAADGSAPQTVVVSAGDSLWSIARSVAPDRDAREVVHALQRANELDGTLQLGQSLVIPDGL